MFNRAAFNRTSFNRPATFADDVNYSAIMEASYSHFARLTAHIGHLVSAVETLSKTVWVSAGIITPIDGITAVGNNADLTATLTTAAAGEESVRLNVTLSCHYSVAIITISTFSKLLYGASGYYGGSTMSAVLFKSLIVAADMITAVQGVATYSFFGNGCADDIIIFNEIVSLNMLCDLILDYSSKITSAAVLKSTIKLGTDYYAVFTTNFRNGYAVINAYISTKAAADYVLEINCILPAGATLVIDSENFTATIDGENVLYAQKGEWVFITRNTQQISLDITDFANTEIITGTLTYRDRYL